MVQWVENPTALALVAEEAQVRSLARVLPYAMGVAMKKEKKEKKKQKAERFLGPSNRCPVTRAVSVPVQV